MASVTRDMAMTYGQDFSMVTKNAPSSLEKPRICEMTIALYKKILELPQNRAVPLLRFMFASL